MYRMDVYQKNFDAWNEVKKHFQDTDHKIFIRAGEIRWISFGVNVGSEIDGKGRAFTRPALIVHVIGSHLALVVPMSTRVRNIAGYVPFEWKDATNALCIHQIRIVSQKRVLTRKGKISNKRLDEVKEKIRKFFSL